MDRNITVKDLSWFKSHDEGVSHKRYGAHAQ